MEILRHQLHDDEGTPLPFTASPNVGGAVDHQYLVIHYTGGSSAAGAIATLTNPQSSASAHLVIARDGNIHQLVPFDRVAWHAGRSRWRGLEGLNGHSLGIELDNAGVLEKRGDRWEAWFGRAYQEEDVIVAVHKNQTVARGWHRYTPEQLDAAIAVGRLLVDSYGLRDVVGHDDIAPMRKVDPGPAFPMEQYRAAVIGRRDDGPEIRETITALNIRHGPGTQFDKLDNSPLPKGTRLSVRAEDSSWCSVDVIDGSNTPTDSGWVHGDYIRPVQ